MVYENARCERECVHVLSCIQDRGVNPSPGAGISVPVK